MHGLLVVKGKKKSHYKDLYDINRYYNILVFKIFVYDLLLIKKTKQLTSSLILGTVFRKLIILLNTKYLFFIVTINQPLFPG